MNIKESFEIIKNELDAIGTNNSSLPAMIGALKSAGLKYEHRMLDDSYWVFTPENHTEFMQLRMEGERPKFENFAQNMNEFAVNHGINI